MSRGSYRAIHTVLIDGADYQALSPDAKLVLLTVKLNLGPSGIDVLYPAVLEPQTGLSARAIARALDELERSEWIRRERNLLWLVNGLRYEPSRTLSNDNHRKEIVAHLDALPRLALVMAFRQHYELSPKTPASHPDAIPMPSEGHGDGIPNHGNGEREKGKTEKGKRTPPADAGDESEPDGFAAVWTAYPRRGGGNPRTSAAKAYRARIREGVPPADLEAGVRRYAAYCEATNATGTRFVMQGATFFGPDRHWAEDYEAPDEYANDPAVLAAIAARDKLEDDERFIREKAARANGVPPVGVPA